MNREDRKLYERLARDSGLGRGCGPRLYVACILVLVMFLICSCRTVRESTTENHSHSQLMERIDSLMRSTTVWQQDFLSRQTSIFESLKQTEKNDSSYSVTLNEKGDTVKEKIIIYREVSTDHSTEKEEKEMWMQKFRQIDSLLKVSLDRQAETDSLLREKEKVVEKELNWWQKAKMEVGGWAIILLAGGIIFVTVRLGKRFIWVYRNF